VIKTALRLARRTRNGRLALLGFQRSTRLPTPQLGPRLGLHLSLPTPERTRATYCTRVDMWATRSFQLRHSGAPYKQNLS